MIEQTGARDAVLLGFSMGGGEVARYMSRHGGKSVVQAVLVLSAMPIQLKTPNSPAGTEQAAFDKTALALNEDRPQFLAGFFRTFLGVDTAQGPVSDKLLARVRGASRCRPALRLLWSA